jgi:hypothetical protein
MNTDVASAISFSSLTMLDIADFGKGNLPAFDKCVAVNLVTLGSLTVLFQQCEA